MKRQAVINRLRDMQREIIGGTTGAAQTTVGVRLDFFYKVADLLESDEKALTARNEIDGKAHALFTTDLNGQGFAHIPEQCNPLGFVEVLRAAIDKLMKGEQLSNPFIHLPPKALEEPK